MEKQTKKEDELHLGDFMTYIHKGIHNIGLAFIRIGAFVLRNAVILVLLIIAGIIWGYFVNQGKPQMHKTQFLVGNVFKSGNYIRNKVDELNSSLNKTNPILLQKVGIDSLSAPLTLAIKPVVEVKDVDPRREVFYNLLAENDFVDGKTKKEMFANNFDLQRISLIYPTPLEGNKILTDIIKLMRKNEFYQKIYQSRHQYTIRQIKSNKFLVRQIDSLVKNYSTNLAGNSSVLPPGSPAKILNLGAVMRQRTKLQKRIQKLIRKKIAGNQFLKILDKGQTKALFDTSILSNKMVIYPVLLIFIYIVGLILWSLFKASRSYNQKDQA